MTARRAATPAALFVISLLALTSSAPAQLDLGGDAPAPVRVLPPAEVDIAHLLRELQWTASDPRDVSMVWLVPDALMEALLLQGGDVDDAEARRVGAAFEPFLVVGVIRGAFDPNGNARFEPPGAVRSSVRLIDDGGQTHRALGDVSGEVVSALSTMEQTLAAALGDLGAHTRFLVFPGVNAAGEPLLPLTERATLTAELAALGPLPPQRVTWRLPLAALLADRICPLCRDGFNGAWSYCPWDGSRLITPPAEAEPPERAETPRSVAHQ